MKKALFLLIIFMVAGCSMSSIESKNPVLDAKTSKTPREYALCLAPIWQQYNPATTSIETATGYRISASATYNGVIALTVVDRADTGSTVRTHLQADWLAGDWLKSARNCL